MAGVRQKHATREQQERGTYLTVMPTDAFQHAVAVDQGAGSSLTECPESLLELGRGNLAGKAAIGSATQGTRWVVQVRESCLREGKSERDWGKSETGGGGESIAAALVPVPVPDQTAAVVADGGRETTA